MGTHLSLTASDGFELGAYRADPRERPKGGLVVMQEIFGVNRHIRSVCDRFAEDGYVAIAPAVFDRYQRHFESGYSPAEIEEARKFIPRIDWRAMLRDTQAAIEVVQSAGKVGIVGYCMGGTVAFLAAAKLDGLSAAIGYYGGQTAQNADLKAEGADAAALRRPRSVDPDVGCRDRAQEASGMRALRPPGGARLQLRRAPDL